MTSRNTPTSLRCSRHSVVSYSRTILILYLLAIGGYLPHSKSLVWISLVPRFSALTPPLKKVPPSRMLDSSNVFTPLGSIESFSSLGPQEIPDLPTTEASHSLNNLHLRSFSFRWDLGLDCDDDDRSVSDYGTVLHTGETDISVPLTIAAGLSAVEEITEGGLTDSRAASTANRITLSMPQSNNELGSLPPRHRKELNAKKDSKSILKRLRSASNRLVHNLSIPWSILAPSPPHPVVKTHVNSPSKVSSTPHPRPKNKLRKKTRPSISITLAVEPVSSFSLAQPLSGSLEVLQTTGASPTSGSPVPAFSSARSFFSLELPPVFSKARFRALQKSKYGRSDDTAVTNGHDAAPSGSRVYGSGALNSQDGHPGKNDERAVSVNNGVGGFPTPINSAGVPGQGDSKEGNPTARRSRLTSPWELGLGVCNLWPARGRR